ncbi:MAG TPA: trypsin-like peptidase domain-containing protein [Pyrinomonadaceae bacterium]|nr:trypsin-like peptidase domain-containing protein [Pyrinomonadaceae bacterium]
MSSGLVVHISSGQERHTEVLSHERIRIGPGEDCDVRLGSDILTDSTIFLELARHNGHYRISEFDPEAGITLNGRPVKRGADIEDGAEMRFADFDLSLRFFPVGELPTVVAHRRASVAPFIEQAAIEASATTRRDDAKVFLREFSRELLREIGLGTKFVTLLIAVALVGGVLYLGNATYREMRRSRDLINRLNDQLARQNAQLDETGKRFQDIAESNNEIRDSLSMAPRLRSQYGNGVCLIAGSYMIFERGTSRPLRYPEAQTTEDGTTLQSGEDQTTLTPEGNGPPFIADFVGTGFHVGDGYVISNRHLVVEPWTANENVNALGASVRGQFRVTRLIAFFPDVRQPFPLRVRQGSERDDIAVGKLDLKEFAAKIPRLPLDSESGASMVGKSVVTMGYPSGEERLLATIPEAEARALQQRFGASIEALLAALSERNHIKPLTTQGHITDLEGRRIVHDATNAVGGSGSPVFGQSGRVIGVNYAAFTGMPDANFAVPIRYLYPLLERAGWKSDEPDKDADANSNSNANNTPGQKDARAPAATANQSRK